MLAMQSVAVGAALRDLLANPYQLLVVRWNWKSALLSSIFRGGIFFAVNLKAGFNEATGALLAEFVLRLATAGFYGAITQAFRRAEPAWQATLAVMMLLPVVQHSLELAVHWYRGTALLAASIAASAVFTVISTTVNLHLMRRGAMIVGHGQHPLLMDIGIILKLLIRPFPRSKAQR